MQPAFQARISMREHRQLIERLRQGQTPEEIIAEEGRPTDQALKRTAERISQFLSERQELLNVEIGALTDELEAFDAFAPTREIQAQQKMRVAFLQAKQGGLLKNLAANNEKIRKAKESIPDLTKQLERYKQLKIAAENQPHAVSRELYKWGAQAAPNVARESARRNQQ